MTRCVRALSVVLIPPCAALAGCREKARDAGTRSGPKGTAAALAVYRKPAAES